MIMTVRKEEVLRSLDRGEPLFPEFPVRSLDKRRILGLEIEFGVAGERFEPAELSGVGMKEPPWFLPNGGHFYVDSGHLEWASPEVSNPVAAVLYFEAGKILARRLRVAPRLYCNNRDGAGNTFGCHESYFTRAPRSAWLKLVPFLIARTLLCGAGSRRRGRYFISQRADSISCAAGEESTKNRPVINLRCESLGRVHGWDRLHLILADTGMSQIGTFLRIGTMELMLDLLERGNLPEVPYNLSFAGTDMASVSEDVSDWILEGVSRGPRQAVKILRVYLEAAKWHCAGRNRMSDTLLIVWEDTLDKLEADPAALARRLDWAAKRELLKTFADSVRESGISAESLEAWLESQDMEYHNADPAQGLYYGLLEQGFMERLVPDELIKAAADVPPSDTRAFGRGRVVEYLGRSGVLWCIRREWEFLHLTVVQGTARSNSFPIHNPFLQYPELLGQVRAAFAL